ncbi:MAG: repressor LexA [Planctomycetes bacterium]|nr:repressor LexA [Planctomycetota bacterium]
MASSFQPKAGQPKAGQQGAKPSQAAAASAAANSGARGRASSARRSDSRERVLEFVRQALERGEPPTVRDVQTALGFRAVESAREHLTRLVAEGRLVQAPGVARGYRLPPSEAPRSRFVPLLGRVAAGAFSEAIEAPEGHVVIEVAPHGESERASSSPTSSAMSTFGRASLGSRSGSRSASRSGELFALRVRGESMVGLGILDGDLVIVRRDAQVHDGDVVVAQVDGEATVKSFFRVRDAIELRPANPAFATLVVASDRELVLLGKVVEVRRYLAGGR